LSRSVWVSCRNRVHNHIKFMYSRSSNLQSVSANTNVGMSSGLQWIDYTKQIIDMFRSVFFANLECMVDHVRYLHDDDDEYQQPNVASESDQSNESKLGDQQIDSTCGICHGNRSNCYCNYPIDRVKWEYTKIRKSVWDSIEQHEQLYRKLGDQQRRGEN
jgi:hypothetical protein